MKRLIFPFVSAAIIILLVSISCIVFFKEGRSAPDDIMARDVQQLAEIFARIDKACGIIKIEHQRNYIDFLQVRSFVSSQIGSLNLRNPQAWEGPYLNDNLMMQGKFYELVTTKQGYFIAPGDGIKLGNGKVIGKDIMLDEFADIPSMLLRTDKLLSANGKPLAIRIVIGTDLQADVVGQEETTD